MSEASTLPAGDLPPSIPEMAGRLVDVMPGDQRSKALELLTQRILPNRLRSLLDHPNPRRLAETVYTELAERLVAVPSAARLEVLQQEAHKADIRDAASRSLNLAIARYAKDHPQARAVAESWLGKEGQHHLSMSVEDLVSEASRGLDGLGDLISHTRALAPQLWEAQRVTLVHTRNNFQSARSGSFATAGGSLGDFLTETGASPDDFAVH